MLFYLFPIQKDYRYHCELSRIKTSDGSRKNTNLILIKELHQKIYGIVPLTLIFYRSNEFVCDQMWPVSIAIIIPSTILIKENLQKLLQRYEYLLQTFVKEKIVLYILVRPYLIDNNISDRIQRGNLKHSIPKKYNTFSNQHLIL